MKVAIFTTIVTLTSMALVAPVWADDGKPLTLNISQDQVKTVDAIAVLQKETGDTFVVDDTVNGTLGVVKVSFPTLPKMLDFLKTMEPGLTYQRLYIPADKPLPAASQCYDIVKTLQWLGTQGPVGLASTEGSLTFTKDPKANTAPSGMREVWFISDEGVRQQRIQDAQKLAADAWRTASAASAAQQLNNGVQYQNGVAWPPNSTVNTQQTNNQGNTNQGNGQNQGWTRRNRGNRNTNQPQQVSPGLVIQP